VGCPKSADYVDLVGRQRVQPCLLFAEADVFVAASACALAAFGF
jgi:hypothetical protein